MQRVAKQRAYHITSVVQRSELLRCTLHAHYLYVAFMSPEAIQAALARPAVLLTRGSAEATHVATQNWLGRVCLSRPGEALPLDAQGQPMWPLLQLVLADLPWVPAALAGSQALTVFVSQQLPVDTRTAPNGQNWLLREYPLGEPLLLNELGTAGSPLRRGRAVY